MHMIQVREKLKDLIAAQMRGAADKLAGGRAADYAAYREGVGRIAGGRDALDAVDAVFHKLLDDEGD